MQQNKKTLLENKNFRNNQNYVIWNSMKSRILSINFLYKNEKLFTILSFISSWVFSFLIIVSHIFNAFLNKEEINILLIFLFPIWSLFILILLFKIIPKIFWYFYYIFKIKKYLIFSMNNFDYKKLFIINSQKWWGLNKIINKNFIIIKK